MLAGIDGESGLISSPTTPYGTYNKITNDYSNYNCLRLYEETDLTNSCYKGDMRINKQNAIDAINGKLILNNYNDNAALNNNFGIILHLDHSAFTNIGVGGNSGRNPSYSTDPPSKIYGSDAYVLENHNTNGDIFSNILVTEGCNPGDFFKDCVAERFINNPSGGSVAVIANVLSGYWSNDWKHERFIESIEGIGGDHLGIAYQVIGTDRGRTLFGDPELPVWTRTPEQLDIAIEISNADGYMGYVDSNGNHTGANITTGENLIEITTGESIKTLVCINKSGDKYFSEEIIGSTIVNYIPNTEGELSLTITGKNKLPYEISLPVENANEAHLCITEKAVYDGISGLGIGDSDGFIDGGETIELPITIRNSSYNTITNVSGNLSTNSEAITMINSDSDFGDLLTMESKSCLENYTFIVNKSVADGLIIDFKLLLTSDQGDFVDSLSYRVKNSELIVTDRLISYDIDDGSGIEHFGLALEFSNYGNTKLNNLQVHITSESPFIQNIQPGVFNYLEIDSLSIDSSTGYFTYDVIDGNRDAKLFIDIEDENGRPWHMEFDANYTSLSNYNIDLNSVVTTPYNNAIMLIWNPLKDNTYQSCRFNIYRSTELNGEYQKINLTPIIINADGKMSYTDLSCEENTIYYYKFSTLFADQSNINVGSMSGPVKVSTLLPTAMNWPVKCIQPCVLGYSPTVTDIDSDGESEIFITGFENDNGYVMGFNADGTEVTNYLGLPEDIDGFAVIGGIRIWSKCAVGDIDDDGTKEIVVSTRIDQNIQNEYIYIYKFKDSNSAPELMDFPYITSPILNEPVIADIDNNGINDIVIASEWGTVYVYEFDDTSFSFIFKWSRAPGGWSTGGITVGDINNDGYKEIIFGGRNGIYVYKYDGSDYLGTQPFFSTSISNEVFWCNPVIANMDLKGNPEIIFTSNEIKVTPTGGMYTSDKGYIYILNSDGTIYNEGNSSFSWNGVSIVMYESVYNVYLPNITVADVTGDFEPEVFIGGKQRLYGFYNWGEPLWSDKPTGIYNPSLIAVHANPVIADIDGDSKYEIVMASNSNNLMYAYNTEDGSPVLGWPLIGNGKSPFIGDINRDNINEIVTSDAEASTYVYKAEGSAEYVEWQSYRANPENTGVYRKTLYEVPADGTITLNDQQKIEVDSDQYIRLLENSKLILNSGSELIIKAGCTLRLYSSSELIVEEGASFVLEEGARVQINGNAKITGEVNNILGRIAVTDNSKLTIGTGSNIVLRYIPVSSVILGNNSELEIESGATISYGPSTTTDCGVGSKITVLGGGTLFAGEYSKFNSVYGWKGIVAGIGSTISAYSATISKAEWGINAQAAKVNLTHNYFSDCDNGLWLLNCSDYNLNDNYFDGKGAGTGIRVTESTGVIKSNTILNHTAGIVAISCSPLISENYLHDNATCGIALYGYNTYPQLLNPSTANDELNNRIINNGLTSTGENGSQIFMMYRANAYLNGGYNNIYSGNENSVPAVPCIKTVSDIGVSQQLKSEVSQVVRIPAEYNYWGIDEITDVNYSSFFELWRELAKGHSIDYDPYATSAYEPGLPHPPHYSTNEPPTQEEQLLKVAMMLEDKGVYTAAIKKYESIIEKYPDSPEYYIATSRLPQVLAKEEESLEPLFITYDDALASDEISNKKFIKQMKVSTKIKDRKYDEAIVLAEQLKAETESETEKNLCDIEIAICNMMKDAQGVAKNEMDYLLTIDKLVNELNHDEKTQPADIAEYNIPAESKLYQNYPNPFNPITQIKFALAKTAEIKLSVYNISGQKVAELANGVKNAGYHMIDFDGSRFNSGVYYYTLKVDGKSFTKKMVLTVMAKNPCNIIPLHGFCQC